MAQGDVSSMADVLQSVEDVRKGVVRVLHVVRIVRDHMSRDHGNWLVGDFLRDLRVVGASLRRLADTIDQETAKFNPN